MTTKKEKLEMLAMRNSGSSLQAIGDAYGITRERVRQILNYLKEDHSQTYAVQKCIFPNIANWMRENDTVTIGGLADKLGISRQIVSWTLTGERDPKKKTIDAILRETGMTYEQAFSRVS